MPRETLLHSVRHEIKTFRRALLSEWAPMGQRRCLFHDIRWYKLHGSMLAIGLFCRCGLGHVLGTLIGLIFLMPLAGAALGAASGTLGGYLTDVGIHDEWMKETAAAVQPGTQRSSYWCVRSPQTKYLRASRVRVAQF